MLRRAAGFCSINTSGRARSTTDRTKRGPAWRAMRRLMATLEAFDFILFGGSGDLAMRKLLPALFYRHRDGGDTRGSRIIGNGRNALSREQYLNLAQQSCRTYIAPNDFSQPASNPFPHPLPSPPPPPT